MSSESPKKHERSGELEKTHRSYKRKKSVWLRKRESGER